MSEANTTSGPFDATTLTPEEKRRLLLNCCRIVHQVCQRIDTMAFSMATIRSDSVGSAYDSAFDVIAPYVLMLSDSEDGLGVENLEAQMYDSAYCFMSNWMRRNDCKFEATQQEASKT